MENQSSFEGLYVVAKFYLSRHPAGYYRCISRTLGKFGIVDKDFKGKVDHWDVWVCRITREIRPGKPSAAFVLMPVKKIEKPAEQLRKLIPGFYEVQNRGGAALILPTTEPGAYWILSRATRSLFEKFYAVVVPVEYKEESVDAIEASPKAADHGSHTMVDA